MWDFPSLPDRFLNERAFGEEGELAEVDEYDDRDVMLVVDFLPLVEFGV